MADNVRDALAKLVEAVSRGDEVGLPEAYRSAVKALAVENNGWEIPLNPKLTRGAAHFHMWMAFEKSPALSMFTKEARSAIAAIAADALPLKEDDEE